MHTRQAWLIVTLVLCGVAAIGNYVYDEYRAEKPSASTELGIVTKTTKENQMIGVIPEVELINGIDDVSPTGNCSVEFKQFCKDVKPGKGRLSDCITQLLEDDGDDGDETEKAQGTISDDCKGEVMQYKILRNQNINYNIPLARACKEDAHKLCNMTQLTRFSGYKPGQVIECLRGQEDQLSRECKRQVFRVKLDAAFDYRADALLYEACSQDADTLCKDVRPGMGRVQACLRTQIFRLSWSCEQQLFRQEVEDADDIRLSYVLFHKCMPDKRKFCADVQPGNGNVKECLEENRNDPDFSPECKDELDAMIERRVHDGRLDRDMVAACDEDIRAICRYAGDMGSISYSCLQDHAEEIKNPTCKAHVIKYIRLASEDIRFNVRLAGACYEDRNNLCSSVPPGSARVIQCLQSQRDKLSPTCRATLYDEEVRFSENIDFQFPMKQACIREIQTFCRFMPHRRARVIRCLQDKKMKKNFGAECRKEVTKFEQGMDERLSFRLKTACKADIGKLCEEACKMQDGQVCGGRDTLHCLREKKDQITGRDCTEQLFYIKMEEESDYRKDVMMAKIKASQAAGLVFGVRITENSKPLVR